MTHSKTGNALPCPACGSRAHRVLDSRAIGAGKRRRRSCPCGHRFSTWELPGSTAWTVIVTKAEIRGGAFSTQSTLLDPFVALDLVLLFQALRKLKGREHG